MPRYVILLHHTPPGERGRRHWDLMLEDGGVLRTWALVDEPWPGGRMAAQRLADHRLKYLDYEGPISRNRGRVRRADHGAYRTLWRAPRRWVLMLAGEKFTGEATLWQPVTGSQRWCVELPAD
jgi:hypothetical protein